MVALGCSLLSTIAVAQDAAVHASAEQGKHVFRKANCFGCHKWHGDGGGGYGGAALSLRRTELDRNQMTEVIACGRPGTGMPYHQRDAYGDGHCYGLTEKDLGDTMPPKAPSLLRASEIDAVADYVIATIKGRGEPTLGECQAFWGAESKMCNSFKGGAPGADAAARPETKP